MKANFYEIVQYSTIAYQRCVALDLNFSYSFLRLSHMNEMFTSWMA